MRTLLSTVILALVAAPAFALPGNPVPEPEMLSLVAIGALGLMLVRRRK